MKSTKKVKIKTNVKKSQRKGDCTLVNALSFCYNIYFDTSLIYFAIVMQLIVSPLKINNFNYSIRISAFRYRVLLQELFDVSRKMT